MRAILICPNEDLRIQFKDAVSPYNVIHLSQTLEAYPFEDELRKAIRAWTPEIVFLSIEGAVESEVVARQLHDEFPAIQRVALHTSQDFSTYRRVLQMKMSQFLAAPFEGDQLAEVLDQLELELAVRPAKIDSTDRCYAFVPAKAGVGASTIAANATWAFSQPEGQSVLLADFDMGSGVTEFMFDTTHEHNLAEVAQREKELEDDNWRQMVKTVGNIDLLLSGAPYVGKAIPSIQLSHLIEYARRNYNIVSADLPDAFDETTLAVLKDFNRIFLVTTPELPALRLARLKVRLLKDLGFNDKVSLLLNRSSKNMELSHTEIEKTIGLPIFASFPCDYADVSQSIRAGRPATKLSRSVQRFTAKLSENPIAMPEKKRFIERFTLTPLRYGYR